MLRTGAVAAVVKVIVYLLGATFGVPFEIQIVPGQPPLADTIARQER